MQRHGTRSEPWSGIPACSRRWAAQRPHAILIRTAILAARSAGRRVASYTLAPTIDLCNATDPVASCASCDGLRSGPGDCERNDGPAARFAANRGTSLRKHTALAPGSEQVSRCWLAAPGRLTRPVPNGPARHLRHPGGITRRALPAFCRPRRAADGGGRQRLS